MVMTPTQFESEVRQRAFALLCADVTAGGTLTYKQCERRAAAQIGGEQRAAARLERAKQRSNKSKADKANAKPRNDEPSFVEEWAQRLWQRCLGLIASIEREETAQASGSVEPTMPEVRTSLDVPAPPRIAKQEQKPLPECLLVSSFQNSSNGAQLIIPQDDPNTPGAYFDSIATRGWRESIRINSEIAKRREGR
jgi:hypothetical protein